MKQNLRETIAVILTVPVTFAAGLIVERELIDSDFYNAEERKFDTEIPEKPKPEEPPLKGKKALIESKSGHTEISHENLPDLVSVNVDGWRYGVAWVGFSKDLGDDPMFTKPDERYYKFQVLIANIDERRDFIPAKWLDSYFFLFYLDMGLCEPDLCYTEYGNLLSTTCGVTHSDIIGSIGEELMPFHGLVKYECSTLPLPDTLRSSNFTVEYAGDSDVKTMELQG